MKKSLFSLLLSSAAILNFTGCGGGGSDSTSPKAEGFKNAVPYSDTCTVSGSGLLSIVTPVDRTMQVGYDGDVAYGCSQFSGMSAYLKGRSLRITDLNKTENITGDVDGENVSATIVYHYKDGSKTIRATIGKNKSYACSERYPSPLPADIKNNDEADALLEGFDPLTKDDYFENESNRIDTTCSDDYYRDLAEIKGLKNLSKPFDIVWKTNYVMTDSTGKTHKVSSSDHLKYKLRVDVNIER